MAGLTRDKNVHLLTALLLLVICLLTFSCSLQNEFKIDDHNFVRQEYDSFFTDFKSYFTGTPIHHYSPIYFLINVNLFKMLKGQLPLYHLFNILLFYILCLLIYAFVHSMTKKENIAFLTTAFYLIHPINVEIVTRISINFLILCSILMLLSLMLFQAFLENPKRKVLFLLSFFPFSLALLTFEGAFLLPFYILLIAYHKHRSLTQSIRLGWPFFAGAGLFFFLWLSKSTSSAGLIHKFQVLNINIFEFLVNLTYLAFWYCGALLNLFDTVWIYEIHPDKNIGWITYALLSVSFAALFVLIARRPWNIKTFAIVWFTFGFPLCLLGSFAHPEMGLIIEPHWFFFSSIGFFIFAAALLSEAKLFANSFARITVLGAIALSLGLSTLHILHITKTEKSYCTYWLSIVPNHHPALMTLANIQMKEENYREALRLYRKLLKINNYKSYQVYSNIGTVYLKTGDYRKARENLLRAIELNPQYAHAYNNLGSVFKALNDNKKAETYFIKSLELAPAQAEPRLNLAEIYIKEKNLNKASDILQAINKDSIFVGEKRNILVNIAVEFLKMDQMDQGLNVLERALEDDSRPGTFLTICIRLTEEGFSRIAHRIVQQALKVYPDNSDLYYFYGTFLANHGFKNEAVSVLEKGVRLNPNEVRFKKLIGEIQKL